MTSMDVGDTFNPKYTYFLYYKQSVCDSPMIRLYIFTVNQDTKYELNNTFDMDVIRYTILQYGIDCITAFTSSIYKRDKAIPYNITSDEIWKLNDDEVNDMLVEVI